MQVRRFAIISAVLCGAALVTVTNARAQGLRITQLNDPNATTGTFAAGVNTKNRVVGVYTYTTTAGSPPMTITVTNGFQWTSGTNYKDIIFPGSNNFTRALAINDSGTIVGDFLGPDGYYHGFTDAGGTLKQYDVPGGRGHFSTSLFGIDNNGDLAGSANGQGFVRIAGVITMFYGSGTDLTYTYGINDSGVAVGQYFDSNNNSHGYMWQAGTVTEIVYPGALQTACEGINNNGEITGYYIDSAKVGHGFTLNGGVYATSDLPFIEGVSNNGSYAGNYVGPPGVTYGYVVSPVSFKPSTIKIRGAQSTSTFAVNNAGVLAGQYTNAKGVIHGMMLNGTTVTNIDDANATAGTTVCNGINNNNQIVGYYINSTTNQYAGFYWAAGKITEIPGPPGSLSSVAYNTNDAGQITGYFVDASNVEHGYVLSGPGGTYTQYDVPGAISTSVWGINSTGTTLTMIWLDAQGFTESSLYNGTTYTSINMPGAVSTDAHSINTNGDIVFTWIDSAAADHGGLLSGGVYYLLDVPGGSGTRADGINDSGIIVGRNLQPGSTTNFNGFKGMK